MSKSTPHSTSTGPKRLRMFLMRTRDIFVAWASRPCTFGRPVLSENAWARRPCHERIDTAFRIEYQHHMPLIDAGTLVRHAHRNRYAVVQINTNGGTYDVTRA